MSTVTLQPDGIEEFYEDGVLTQVIGRYELDHPVHGFYQGSVSLPDNLMVAWGRANEAAQAGLLRSAITADATAQATRLDSEPVHTGVTRDDSLFGAPIEL